MLFNTYYINFPKVYEIKMMLSNIDNVKFEVQRDVSDMEKQDIKAQIGAQFLNFFSSHVDAAKSSAVSETQKVLESFEIKMTKSTILKEVIEKSKLVTCFDDKTKEGELIRIDNVALSLENEAELRVVKLFSNGMFKGFKVPGGIDINNVFNSMFKDYAYKIKGDFNAEQKVLVKIPMTFENEFENMYCVDDLFIGKVTIVGIYKGKARIDELKNSFQFFQELSGDDIGSTEEYQEIHNSQYEEHVKKIQFISSNDERDYHYIDVLAIIQQIETTEQGDKK